MHIVPEEIVYMDGGTEITKYSKWTNFIKELEVLARHNRPGPE